MESNKILKWEQACSSHEYDRSHNKADKSASILTSIISGFLKCNYIAGSNKIN